jgi:hypothetical protein
VFWARIGKIRAIRRNKEFLVLDPMVLELADPKARERSQETFPILRGTEVAKMLGISPRHLRHIAKKADLGHVVHRNVRYSVKDVRELFSLQKHGTRSAKPKEKRQAIVDWALKRLQQNP